MKEPAPKLTKQEAQQSTSPERAGNLESKLADIRREAGIDYKHLEKRILQMAESLKKAVSDENLTREDLLEVLIDTEDTLRDMLTWTDFIKGDLR
jgi:hypothetical protein